MKYQGSKNRIGFEIFSFIQWENPKIKNWIEPFVGGANMIDKVPNGINRMWYDNNHYLIAMFNELKNGFIPPDTISEEEYIDIKNNKDKYPMALVGFVGIGCSFAGKWFGGYARGGTRNYCLESKNNILKQKENLLDVLFSYGDYKTSFNPLLNPKETVIYCDPPYAGTTKYHTGFDHIDFWDWANGMSKYYKIYVSEYEAPSPWRCVWKKEIVSSLTKNTGSKKGIEKLFTR